MLLCSPAVVEKMEKGWLFGPKCMNLLFVGYTRRCASVQMTSLACICLCERVFFAFL